MDTSTELRRCLLNDLRGIRLEDSEALVGYIVRDYSTGHALYTAYVSPSGYSVYRCETDVRGYDLADEIELKANASLFSAVSAIKSDHMAACPEHYTRAKEIWEGAADELCGFWEAIRP